MELFLPEREESTQLHIPATVQREHAAHSPSRNFSSSPRPPQPKDDVNTVLGIGARVKAEATVTSSEAGTSIRYQTAIIKRNEDPKNAKEKTQHSTKVSTFPAKDPEQELMS